MINGRGKILQSDKMWIGISASVKTSFVPEESFFTCQQKLQWLPLTVLKKGKNGATDKCLIKKRIGTDQLKHFKSIIDYVNDLKPLPWLINSDSIALPAWLELVSGDLDSGFSTEVELTFCNNEVKC